MKVLSMGRWHPEHLAALKAQYPDSAFASAVGEAEALAQVGDADVVWGHVSRGVFLAARKLRWLQHKGAGMNWLRDVPELVASDVVVTNAAGAAAATVADHVFAMLLSFVRDLPALREAQADHRYLGPRDYHGGSLAGMTLGVLGLGHIGRAVARRGHAFDMRVFATDASDRPRPDYVTELWGPRQFSGLVVLSDALVICAPLTEETANLLDAQVLDLMKPTAYLFVVSRGGIVDEEAVIAMLRSGRLAGAGIDVFAFEETAGQHVPLPDSSPLWDVPNLIVTPHCASHSPQTMKNTRAIFDENLARFVNGKPLVNVVDKRRGY
jgi:phosphoglycerate dehydrogenase-like enzyme